MNNKNYRKFLKYQLKCQDCPEQDGGSAIFNPFSKNNRLMKQKELPDGRIAYADILIDSNIFTNEQKQEISNFIDFILPNINMNNKYFGKHGINDIEVLSAGGFGVTLFIDSLLIKIIKINAANNEATVAELSTLLYISYLNQKTQRVLPNSINKIIGYITGNKNITRAAYEKHPHPIYQELSQNNIYTTLNARELNPNNLLQTIQNIENHPPINQLMPGNILIIFLEKADYDLNGYISKELQTLDGNQKIIRVKHFLKDMAQALSFMHIDLKLIHCDIKEGNIVVKSDPNNPDNKTFQLIDFGLARKIKSRNDVIVFGAGTGYYMFGTPFEKYKNILYDWYCIYIVVLSMLGLLDKTQGRKPGPSLGTNHLIDIPYTDILLFDESLFNDYGEVFLFVMKHLSMIIYSIDERGKYNNKIRGIRTIEEYENTLVKYINQL